MFRDIGIQWEPLDEVENLEYTTDRTNNDPVLPEEEPLDEVEIFKYSNEYLFLSKEISSLKADNWSLKLSLADSLQCSNNLQVQSYTHV